ncbi:MAG: thiamine biosynthesis protein ThiS [Nitrosopumilus sp.]|nr:thiamine biosynthesis protein ThiS [Nitrosopumilus sp.]NNL59411.1 thiamine biosynthesis protein ThiS [Nitrosopumilus sp.]
MITVKLVGGAKKIFLTDKIELDKSDISIQGLIDLLLVEKPKNTPKLDTENILIAINGTDSSAMEGKSTIIKNNDIVSIIPVIHGGSTKTMSFEILKKQIRIISIKGQKSTDETFLLDLRKKYPKIKFQAISSDFVLNKYHLKKILDLSFENEKNKSLLSKKIETDILMRFALSKQISDAIKIAGIKPKNDFILIMIGNKKYLDLVSNALKPLSADLFKKNHSDYLKKYFRISKKQLESIYSKNSLEDIIIEKATILL